MLFRIFLNKLYFIQLKDHFTIFAVVVVNKNYITEMSAIIILIILGIVVAGGFLVAFIWAVRSGQYDDDYSPSVRMLFENKKHKEDTSPSTENLNPKQ